MCTKFLAVSVVKINGGGWKTCVSGRIFDSL